MKSVTGGLLGLVLLSGRGGAIAPEPQLEGWVRLASGQAAAGVQVRLYDLADPTRSLGVATDEVGYFSLAAPHPAGEADALPRRFELFQNYPNPFNPSTIIPYQLPAPGHVRLEVFNVLGQHVATLVDQEQQAGLHTATWHGTDAAGRAVAAGLYLYRLRGSGLSETRRMVLIDGPITVPGAAPAPGISTRSAAPETETVYGLTVSGRDVVTHVDPDFRTGAGPVEIVVEARAGAADSTAMKAAASGSRILGDVDGNGRVDIIDALLVGLYSLDASITIPNNGDISLGDVNHDGLIDITDAYLIATYSVDPTDPSLPAGIGAPVIVVPEGKMYWVDRWTAKVQRANLDGSEVEDLITTGLEEPTDLALDVAGGKMYWTDVGTDKIQRANLDGSQIEDLVTTGLGQIAGLALDVAGGKMYWTDQSWRKIQRANLDGSQIEDLVTTGLGQIAGLALDVAGGKMYWTDVGTDKIQRANLDGSQIEDLVTTGLGQIAGLALDVAGGKMYWTDQSWRKIQRANLDGSQIEDLVTTGLGQIAGLALDVAGGKMYWTDVGTDKIQRANLDGSRVEVLVTTGLRYPANLVLVIPGGKMYWTEGAKIQRSNLDGSQVEELLTSGLRAPADLVLVIPGGKMYWTEGAKIQRSNLDGSQVEELLTSGLRAPRGLALDLPGLLEVSVNRPPVLDLIGKQSLEEDEILRIDLFARDPEGTEVTFKVQSDDPGVAAVSLSGRQLTISPAGLGLATVAVTASDASGISTTQNFEVKVTEPVPESRGRMYWTDVGTFKIQRSNLDGSQVEDLVTTGLDYPRGLALDVAGGKMYWVDVGTFKIQRANLDGSQVEDLVTTGSVGPRAVALDVNGGKMYWTGDDWTEEDGRTIEGRIQRANLDGTQVEDLLTDPSEVSDPGGLALDLAAGKMYWTDTGYSSIERANLDGSDSETLVYEWLNAPWSLALDLARGKVYWADPGTMRIQRANLDGSQVEDVIVSGLGDPAIGLALDSAGGKLYWTDRGTKKILRSNLDGTRVEDLVTGLSEPVGLALEILVPDLVAASLSVNPPRPAPGQSLTLSVTIHNRGNAPTAPATLRYYRSTDSTITSDDTEVGTGPVRGLSAPGTTFKLIRLTAPSSPGTYYYGACVQPVGGEVNIRNNCSTGSAVVVVAR